MMGMLEMILPQDGTIAINISAGGDGLNNIGLLQYVIAGFWQKLKKAGALSFSRREEMDIHGGILVAIPLAGGRYKLAVVEEAYAKALGQEAYQVFLAAGNNSDSNDPIGQPFYQNTDSMNLTVLQSCSRSWSTKDW